MKVWNKPELAEINLSATESGYFDCEYEIWPFINDSLKRVPCTPQVKPQKPNSNCGGGEEEKKTAVDLFSGE